LLLLARLQLLLSTRAQEKKATNTTIFSPLVRTGVDGNDVLALVAPDEQLTRKPEDAILSTLTSLAVL
jgi:hypothetical protein